MTSPVKTVLEAALKAPKPAVFSYRDDFEYLWGKAGPLYRQAGSDSPSDLVIIWDRIPDEVSSNPHAINIADHLTALDWVVALCCAANRAPSPPPWRVFLIDLQPPEHSAAFATRVFPDFHSRLPWIKVCRPPMLHSLLAFLAPDDRNRLPHFKKDQETFELLQQLWQGRLTRPEGRHSIANLIGPRLLLAGMEEPPTTSPHDGALATGDLREQPVQQSAVEPSIPMPPSAKEQSDGSLLLDALQNLMKTMHLVPDSRERERGPWIDPSDWRTLVQRFILVDDMYALGWESFLRRALGIPYADSDLLRVADKPDLGGFGKSGMESLISLLTETTGDQTTLRLNNKGALSLTGEDREVLFLDLRLFSMRPSEEFPFLAKLLALAAQAVTTASDRHSARFEPGELRLVKDCVDLQQRETEGYYVALTLLPRLLAIVDPWLPIVLFSSTGQKHIVDRLAPYTTIILEFDKPRFFGAASQGILTDTKRRFQRALNQALSLLKGRGLCLSLQTSL